MSRKFLTPIVLPADPATAMEAATKQYVDTNAGGTTILHGIGPPTDAIGDPGDYYLDEATDILYGPRAGGPYPDQVAEWAGPHTGAMTGGYTFGMRCIFARVGEVRGVNMFIPSGYEATGYPITLSLWTTGGTRLGSKAQTAGWVANAWNRLLFDAPVAVTATTYIVSYHNLALRVTAPDGVFPVGGVTSGDIRIPTNAESPNQSVYASGDAFPNNAFWPTTGPVSPIFRETAGTTWPMAIGSGNEVFIGTDDPIATAPTTELWYDTDAPAVLTNDYRWNTAWGIVALGSTVGGILAVGAGATVAFTNPLSFTTIVGRRYRVVCRSRATTTAVAQGYMYLRISGSGITTNDTYRAVHANMFDELDAAMVFDGTGVAGSYSVSVYANVAMSVYADQAASSFYIEDLGPIAGSIPAVDPAQPWQNWTPTLTQGVAVGLTVNSARYTQIGKTVIGNFMVTATSSGTLNATFSMNVPVPMRTESVGIRSFGTAYVNIGSVGQMMLHIANYTGQSSISFIRSNSTNLANFFGADPGVQIVSGNTLGGTFTYEAA